MSVDSWQSVIPSVEAQIFNLKSKIQNPKSIGSGGEAKLR
ncbi:hypothetical protein AVDCRST_MAG84-6625 [uncultured Microcoleus sp.]|uniref:Uncharacterized protein n=1 Tax=uncultured Microcoleus sp. TaxID=259945 RepID=A0A6J4PB67_9CYAN|nr:hypothetical protein AVDCRST_MAG84-6625 [uncultured Microcoleus sp.]